MFFEQLDFLGWNYALLTCGGLYFLFWLSKRHEKRAEEQRQYKNQLRFEENQRKQLIRMKEKGTLDKLKKMDPFQFEEFIKELYDFMGYETQLTKKSGDGGKDVIIKRGSENAIVECKRFNSPKVGRPHIQKFHSAIIDTNSKRGYFVTTGEFAKTAVDYCKDKPITLIDGEELVKLIHKTIGQHEGNSLELTTFQSIDLFEGEPTS
jgi:restriction endonuclease Mrr